MSDQTAPLKIAWCSAKASKYACVRWHYSRTMPSGKTAKLGVWEDGRFIGSVIFGSGANRNIGMPYGLNQHQVCELVRVALDKHKTPVTRIISICLKMLRKRYPGLKVVVSYADTEQGHQGIIYKAGNWVFEGETKGDYSVWFRGEWRHKRTVDAIRGNHIGLPRKETKPKLKFHYMLK